MEFLSSQTFWAFVFAMVAGLLLGYFLLRQALVDAYFEIKRREEEQKKGRR